MLVLLGKWRPHRTSRRHRFIIVTFRWLWRGMRQSSFARRMTADGHRTVGVVDDVVADAAQQGPSHRPQTPCSNDDHLGFFGFGSLNDCLARTAGKLDYELSIDLENKMACKVIWITCFYSNQLWDCMYNQTTTSCLKLSQISAYQHGTKDRFIK